jgi:hypothetical protein
VRAAGLVAALLLTAPLGGCIAISETHGLTCPAGEDRRQVAELTFGRNIGQTLGVSEADFARFLDEVVSPRFPDGFTVSDSQGRWLYRGVVYNEPGKRLSLILPGHPDDRRKVGEIAAAYEDRFKQDAVLSMIQPTCVSFHLPKDRTR